MIDEKMIDGLEGSMILVSHSNRILSYIACSLLKKYATKQERLKLKNRITSQFCLCVVTRMSSNDAK